MNTFGAIFPPRQDLGEAFDGKLVNHTGATRIDGVATFWRKRRFECVHSETFTVPCRNHNDRSLRASILVLEDTGQITDERKSPVNSSYVQTDVHDEPKPHEGHKSKEKKHHRSSAHRTPNSSDPLDPSASLTRGDTSAYIDKMTDQPQSASREADESSSSRQVVSRSSSLSSSFPSQRLIIANCHLVFNFSKSDVKVLQLCALISRLHDLRFKYISSCTPDVTHRMPNTMSSPDHLRATYIDGVHSRLPAVCIVGDLNLTPESPLYHWLTTGTANQDLEKLAADVTSAGVHAPRHSTQRLISGNQCQPMSPIPSSPDMLISSSYCFEM